MSRHRQNPEKKPLTIPQRIAYGIGGATLVGGGLFYGTALASDAFARTAETAFNAPEHVTAPIHEHAQEALPDAAYEWVDSMNSQGAAIAVEAGAAALALLGAQASLTFARRALTAPRPPEQTPPTGPPTV